MDRTGESEPLSGRETVRELVYAVPAGSVIFVHVIVALVALGGVVMGVTGLESTSTSLYRLLIPLAVLVAAVAATALSAALWSRRSWWIIVVPACTVPCMLIAGFAYMAVSWSY
jgi:hypothetical protein